MVIPLVGEAEWVERLSGAVVWVPGGAPMVVVAPHPDDETLAAGGLIAMQRARGVDVTVVAVTDGEHAYEENEGLAELRSEEQACALERLGVGREKIVRLRLTDSGVSQREAELVVGLRALVTAETVVVAPWVGDFHPDHEACGRAAKAVAESVGATVVWYFFWTWHRGVPATLDGLELRKFELDEGAMTAKREALGCHVSQLRHAPEPEILPEELLWPARMGFEVFAL